MANLEIKKIINDFLPDKIFDAHMHLYHKDYMVGESQTFTLEGYYKDLSKVIGNREVLANIIPYPSKKVVMASDDSVLNFTDKFLYEELSKNPNNVGEILVLPNDTEESILKRIKSERICGFKPYHLLNGGVDTTQLDIEEYLPESAFSLADKLGKVITLHLVKDKALSDEKNLNYIITMAKKYPNAKLILAHAARGFASWTTVESIDKIKNLDNVWYDLSAVCESPAIFEIIRKCGTTRVVWGSDYPISNIVGKAVSIADKFYWIDKSYNPEIAKEVEMLTVFEENILAVRQAFNMLDLTKKDIEDIFYNNSLRLLYNK
ncbi:MAG: amidohydrolase family protein [Clostridia bacterium]|nr:amidohydrolase family protein [Clostridia bacterium]